MHVSSPIVILPRISLASPLGPGQGEGVVPAVPRGDSYSSANPGSGGHDDQYDVDIDTEAVETGDRTASQLVSDPCLSLPSACRRPGSGGAWREVRLIKFAYMPCGASRDGRDGWVMGGGGV
jgi:hypothetical protein